MKRLAVENQDSIGPIALNKWLAPMGVTPITAWRWRCKGWLSVLNICGRLYISREAIAEFQRRAASGEFSQEHQTPKRKKTAQGVGSSARCESSANAEAEGRK